jgi:virulence-associated protein VagC
MGLLDNLNQNTYYNVTDPKGDYQFTTLEHIINAFMFTYVGESKIITKVSRTDVQFHAMRAVQELSYDVFRSVKSQEIEIPSTLRMPLPHDYVNYVKVCKLGSNGIEKVLYPTGKTSNPFAIEQDEDGIYQFEDSDGDAIVDTLNEQGDVTPAGFESNTLTTYQNQTPLDDTSATLDVEIESEGRRYGLDPQYAQENGTFYIDYRKGFIHFDSSCAGETIILKYVSDGLGTDEEMIVHKFAEEAVYKHIAYGILSTRSNMPEYIVQRFKKERFAETRKAKIRLSNIKIEEFTQVLKGMGKQIK